MKVGVNWSGQRELLALEKILSSKKIDFVEILIDNFLCVDPADISNFLDGIPVNFHIMNSRFIYRDKDELIKISDSINRLADHLQPEYVSDHIGIFYYDGLPLPQMAEINYSEDLDLILNKIHNQLLYASVVSIIPYCIAVIVLDAVASCLVSILRVYCDQKVPPLIKMIAFICFGVPISLFFFKDSGISGVLTGFIIGNSLAVILLSLRFQILSFKLSYELFSKKALRQA